MKHIKALNIDFNNWDNIEYNYIEHFFNPDIYYKFPNDNYSYYGNVRLLINKKSLITFINDLNGKKIFWVSGHLLTPDSWEYLKKEIKEFTDKTQIYLYLSQNKKHGKIFLRFKNDELFNKKYITYII